MLFDLFSSLDFNIFKKKIFSSTIWLLSFIWIFFFLNFFYLLKNYNSIINFFLNKTYLKIKIKILKKIKFSKLLFMNVFLFILFTKLIGIYPFIFGKRTQIAYRFCMRLRLWLSLFLSKIFFNIKRFSGHLTPEGSPVFLIYILKKIEIFRKLIRPLTLSLRLSINISTGHVFFVLLCKGLINFFFLKKIFFLIFFLFIIIYIFFEFGICFLQSFVFSLLYVQYLDEHKTNYLRI